jgi:hypothetical protein
MCTLRFLLPPVFKIPARNCHILSKHLRSTIPFLQRLEIKSDHSMPIRIQYDPADREMIVQGFEDDKEAAFVRIGIEKFLEQAGLKSYVEAKVKIALDEKLRSKSAILEADALRIENEAAQLLCPFVPGDIVQAAELTGSYEVNSIFLYHSSWAITAFRVIDQGRRKDGRVIRLSEKDRLRPSPD